MSLDFSLVLFGMLCCITVVTLRNVAAFCGLGLFSVVVKPEQNQLPDATFLESLVLFLSTHQDASTSISL